jgi:hypothetical protein
VPSTSCSSSGSRRALPAPREAVAAPEATGFAVSSADGSSARTPSHVTVSSSTRRAQRASQRLVLVREAAGDEGVPREPSPFWEDVRDLFDLAGRCSARPVDGRCRSHVALESAPSERERLRALRPPRSGGRRRRRCTGSRERLVSSARSCAGAFDRGDRPSVALLLSAPRGEDGLLSNGARAFADCSSPGSSSA